MVLALNEKGNSDTVKKLMRLVQILGTRFKILLPAVIFDGDPCFNGIHGNFGCEWRKEMTAQDETSISRRLAADPLLICDSLDLLKQLRYRWVTKRFSVVVSGETYCSSLERICEVGCRSAVVFTNSQESKMHDLLPFECLSARALCFVLANDLLGELMIVAECLLVVALTLPGLSTRMRPDLLEIGFWIVHILQCISFGRL
jgi:hypothetical protein